MNKKFMIVLAFCLCTASLFAQNSINGTTVDTTAKIGLEGTTVVILIACDSTLCKFTYTKPDGSFSMSELDTGRFILMITRRGYADYTERFTLAGAHNFGNINMQLKERLLQEVMIKGEVRAIKIKGDTTEYNAKAYVIQPNDKVEDLLRQLPGIQVDQNGKITAQGFTVSKVLVDGEEFFGDDPTLVTRNIHGDMVSKVQLYDKKSDQATFTGIDDGIKTKTINIQLKEDKRNGVFGKADAGSGTEGHYQGQALYNLFRGNEKLSAYATVANTGKVGLGYLDNNRLGTTTLQIGDNGLIPLPTNGDLDASTGLFDGKGLPVAINGGLHYDNKWADDRETINANYKIGSLSVTGNTETTSQQNLPTGAINSNNSQNYNNSVFRQKLDIAYQLKIDTSASIKVAADATVKNTKTNSTYQTTSTIGDNIPLNEENRSISNDGQQHLLNGSLFYTKKFKKPRRTFSWNVSESYANNQVSGYLNSAITYYNAVGIKDSTAQVNQYKMTNSVNSYLNSNMSWSEPLSKKMALVFNYGLGINNSTNDNQSFNQSASGQYDILDPVYSNNYQFNELANQAGAVFNYKTNNATLNFGAKVTNIVFKQTDEYTGNIYKRNFVNWSPQASYQYNLSKYRSLSLNYTGTTIQPTISQLQPILVNTDPLFTTVGNPDLKPSFTHNFSAVFRGTLPVSGMYFYIGPNYSFTSDAIVNNTTTDAAGKTIIGYNNLSGNQPYDYSFFFNAGETIKPLNLGISLTLNTEGNVSYSYINNVLDRAQSSVYSASLNLSKSKQNAYSINASVTPEYSINNFSLQPQVNNNAAGFATTGRGTLYLPGRFQFSADINHTYKAPTAAFNEQQFTILNSAISKTFLKDNNLKLSITGNDLLNQNLSINRRISGNTITQTGYSGIRRYFLLSITWDFTKFGTVPVKN